MKTMPLAAFVLLASITAAADSGQPQADCEDSSAAAALRYIGKWTVDWTYRTAPGEYGQATGLSRITGFAGTCGLRERFEAMRGQAYFYDWTANSLGSDDKEAVWIDSAHGGFLPYESAPGTIDWPVRFVWRHENGRLQTRFQYSPVTDGGFTIERHLSSDGGESWALTSRAKYAAYGAQQAASTGATIR